MSQSEAVGAVAVSPPRRCRPFWDEPAVLIYWHPRLARRAGRALAYLSLTLPGFLLGSALLDPWTAPEMLPALLLTALALGLATLRPRYNAASVLLCLLGALLSGVLAAALWAATPLPHLADAARASLLWGEPFTLPSAGRCMVCSQSVACSLTLVGVATLGALSARIGRVAACHEACAQQDVERRASQFSQR